MEKEVDTAIEAASNALEAVSHLSHLTTLLIYSDISGTSSQCFSKCPYACGHQSDIHPASESDTKQVCPNTSAALPSMFRTQRLGSSPQIVSVFHQYNSVATVTQLLNY
jgi:hypothetical protein